MPSLLLASDAFVVCTGGPVRVSDLQPAADVLWLVGRDGALHPARLIQIDVVETTAWRLLTSAGDVLVAEEAMLMTGDGLLGGRALADRIRAGDRIRIDTISPTQLPLDNPPRMRLTRELARASLAALGRAVVRLPHNGTSMQTADRVARVLSTAKIDWEATDDERWRTYHFDLPSSCTAPARELSGIAVPLQVLTAWEVGPLEVTSRIRAEEASLAAILTAALTASKTVFGVQWLPQYYPIEGRISLAPEARWPVFIEAIRGFSKPTSCAHLEVPVAGKAITGLAFAG